MLIRADPLGNQHRLSHRRTRWSSTPTPPQFKKDAVIPGPARSDIRASSSFRDPADRGGEAPLLCLGADRFDNRPSCER